MTACSPVPWWIRAGGRIWVYRWFDQIPHSQIATGNAKRFTPANRRQIWLQNQGIRALPYVPGKNWILSLATRGVKEAANAITLPSPAPY